MEKNKLNKFRKKLEILLTMRVFLLLFFVVIVIIIITGDYLGAFAVFLLFLFYRKLIKKWKSHLIKIKEEEK